MYVQSFGSLQKHPFSLILCSQSLSLKRFRAEMTEIKSFERSCGFRSGFCPNPNPDVGLIRTDSYSGASVTCTPWWTNVNQNLCPKFYELPLHITIIRQVSLKGGCKNGTTPFINRALHVFHWNLVVIIILGEIVHVGCPVLIVSVNINRNGQLQCTLSFMVWVHTYTLSVSFITTDHIY